MKLHPLHSDFPVNKKSVFRIELIIEIKISEETLVTRTKKEYNIRGEMIARINTLGTVAKYTYDHCGNLIQTEDALDGISLFTCNYND